MTLTVFPTAFLRLTVSGTEQVQLTDKAIRTLNGLANRFGIRRIVLLAFDVRLHVGRRHKFNFMPERRELPCQ
jgi:hypothetical protein